MSRELAAALPLLAATIAALSAMALLLTRSWWRRRCARAEREREELDCWRKDVAKGFEIRRSHRNEPSRVRRQLAADLLFPGLYSTEDAAAEMIDDGVYNWILIGTYTSNNPRHLLLISKVKELETREKAEQP